MKSLAVCALLALLALPSAAAPAALVKDINPGPPGSNPRQLATLDGAVLFFASGGLWRSDGTEGGTWQLHDRALEPVNQSEQLFFFLDDLRALWVTDGTVGGTFQLTPAGVSIQWQGLAALSFWVPSQGALYFVGQDTDHGYELWRTDGTAAGTHLVADIQPGFPGSSVEWLTEYKGQVWFFANDGQNAGALWRTDGTPAGTVLAIDLPPLPPFTDSMPIRVVGSLLTFFAPNAGGILQLWAGDGTAQGTRPITGLSGKKFPVVLLESSVRGNRLYFAAEDRKGHELWVSDGTRRGTRALTNFPNHAAFGDVGIVFQPHEELNGRFLFWANDGTHGVEPWITDGTRQGTRLLRDICTGNAFCSGAGTVLRLFNGRLYFTAANRARGDELWSTDGKSARFVADICPGICSSLPYSPFVLDGFLYFVAQDGQHGHEIWATRGTAAETFRTTDFALRYPWVEEDGFQGGVLDGKLLFAADGGVHGLELWVLEP